jgi:glycosyltransferase involved in cell wall biosynthesis
MKILFLTAHLPYPPTSGGRRREFELIRRLGEKFEIHLCSLTASPEIDNIYAKYLRPYCRSISTAKVAGSPSCLDNYSNRNSYPFLMKKYYSEEGIYKISFLLREHFFSVIHVEGYYLMQLLPSALNIPILLVEHNIEYLLDLQRFALSSRSSTSNGRFYLWQEFYHTFYWERRAWNMASRVVTLTKEEETTVRRLEPHLDVVMIPNGIDHKLSIKDSLRSVSVSNSTHSMDKGSNNNGASILFVCNFAYNPNVDAALYFSTEIFPIIREQVPDVRLFLVGNSPPTEIRRLAFPEDSRIEVTGYVDSLDTFYKASTTVVCPLRIGGGVKVKLLEAIRAGKAIVSTSVGAQGFNLKDSKAICISDKKLEFAKIVIKFLTDPEARYQQEKRALLFSKSLPDWEQVIEEYVRCYNRMIPIIAKS